MWLLLLACASAPPSPAPPVAPVASAPPASAPPAATPPPSRPPPVGIFPASERVVSIADLHGDPAAALAGLRLAGLVDAEGRWSGGAATLVQTGDTTDRGPDSKGVLALLRRLQSEAAAAGGRVISLLGNHEVMNMMGDWRYVSPEDLKGYGGEMERRFAYSAKGEDGAWLRGSPATAKVGDSVFVHGGIDARWAALGIDGINAAIRDGIDARQKPQILGDDGPLWNRSFALVASEAAVCDALTQTLAALDAARMVVGHTVQEDGRIRSRCEGRLWLTDTGASAHYGGHTSALEIRGGAVTPLHP